MHPDHGRQVLTAAALIGGIPREWGYAGNVAYDREHEQALRLARRLEGARTLVIRASTWTFKSVEATLPVDGAGQALGRVYRDCGDGDVP